MYVLKAAELVQKISDTVTLTAYILFDISLHIASTAQIGQNLDSFLKVTVCSNKAQRSATPKPCRFQPGLFGGMPLVLYNGSVLAYLQATSFPDLLHRLATSD